MAIVPNGPNGFQINPVQTPPVSIFAKIYRQWYVVVIILCIPFTYLFVKILEAYIKSDVPHVVVVKKNLFKTVQIGDSVYVKDAATKTTIFELYRPEQAADIRKMNLSRARKNQLIENLDTIQANVGYPVYQFIPHDIEVAKTALVGVVVGKDTSLLFENDLNTTIYHLEIRPVKNVYTDGVQPSQYGNFYPLNKFYVKANEVSTTNFYTKK